MKNIFDKNENAGWQIDKNVPIPEGPRSKNGRAYRSMRYGDSVLFAEKTSPYNGPDKFKHKEEDARKFLIYINSQRYKKNDPDPVRAVIRKTPDGFRVWKVYCPFNKKQ